MTFNPYSLQYYSFRKGKIGFARTVPVSWTTPMSIASVTVDSFQKRIFALQITDNSFGKEKNREDSVIVPTHYLLLENLLCDYKPLIINTPRKPKQPKETNWKQKFQKNQNENICLIYLNTENNGNFHFLSYCAAFLKV